MARELLGRCLLMLKDGEGTVGNRLNGSCRAAKRSVKRNSWMLQTG